MTSGKPVLLLLGRPDCHLCEEFREALEQAYPGQFDVREACVDERAEWRTRFGTRIPVLLDGAGVVLAEGRFDAKALGNPVRSANERG